jgi:hypothetical protein
MHLQIQLLRRPDELRRTLRDDGWTLEADEATSVRASHPSVPDEAAARSRLDQLGLLTSASLRVEFHRSHPRGLVVVPLG